MSTAARTRPDPRISRRRMAVARARRRRLTMRITGALGGVILVWAITWSPLLKVHHIEVEGGDHTSSRAVAEAAGIGEKDNLLFVSASDVAERTEELPWVESARVDRILPNTVRVRVVERVPAMEVTGEQGSWLVDKTGRVLAPTSKGDDIPTIAATDLGAVEPGATIQSLAIRSAVRAFGSMPRELQAMVKGGAATSSERITFSLRGGTLLLYGAAEQIADKNEVALALIHRFSQDEEGVEYIDVRVPSNPAVSRGVAEPEVEVAQPIAP